MRRVILDTNFLLIPYIFHVDIFSEINRLLHEKYELMVLDLTVMELNKIMCEQKGKDKDAAKMAIALIKDKKISIIQTNSDILADKYLIENCCKEDIVATQDMELKRALREKNINIIILRKKKYLNMVEI